MIDFNTALSHFGIVAMVNALVLFGQKVVKSWVDRVVRHFQQDGILHSEDGLESFEEVVGPDLELDDLVLLFHVPDPLAGLELRIDHNWILQSLLNNDGVIDGYFVFG